MTTLEERLPEPEAPMASPAGRRTGLESFALGATYLSAATTPWNGWLIGGVRPGDIFLFLALLAFFASGTHRSLPRLPGWVWFFGAVITSVAMLHEIFPTDAAYLGRRDVLIAGVVNHGIALQDNVVVGLKFVVPIVGLPLMFASAHVIDRRALFRVMYAFAIGSAISALIGFTDLEGLSAVAASVTGQPAGGGRAAGLAVHPNFLALTCVSSLPFALWRILAPRIRDRVYATICVLLLLVGLYVSGSRAGAAVAAGVIALTFFGLPSYRRVLPTVALLSAVVLSVVFVVKPSLGAAVLKAVRLNSDDGSAAGSDLARAIVNNQGDRDFSHSPLDGVGLQVAGEAHNVYLQALAAGGVLLLTGYLIYLLGALVWCVRRMPFDSLAYPLFVAAVGGILFNFVQSALTERVGYVPLAVIAAMPALHPRPVAG